MPRVVALEDVRHKTINRGTRQRIEFLDSSPAHPEQPFAILTKEEPGRFIGTHFHIVDQWQVVTDGKCTLGREDAGPYCIHFTRAYTPYGPLACDGEVGMSNFVMFTRYQPGAQYIAEKRELLKQVPDRQPWQIKRSVLFPSQEGRKLSVGVELRPVPDVRDDKGLFAYSLAMAPGTEAIAPDPSGGEGQYILIVRGSLWHENRDKKAIALVHIDPKDGPFPIHAGSEGLEALILNFPRTANRVDAKPAINTPAGFKKWRCVLCGFSYDEAEGLPDEGIPPGTRWEDVPDDWSCPDCSASKADFQMVEVG